MNCKSAIMGFLTTTMLFPAGITHTCMARETLTIPEESYSEESATIFSGEFIRIVQSKNTYWITEKENNETIIVTKLSDTEYHLVDELGNTTIVTFSSDGTMFVDGNVYIAPIHSISSVADIDNTNSTWHYLQTTHYNTQTQGTTQSIVLGILSFCPYIGAFATIAGIVEAFKSLGQPMMYVWVDEYYIDGYSQYKYNSFFYSDPNKRNLIRTNSEIRQMW